MILVTVLWACLVNKTIYYFIYYYFLYTMSKRSIKLKSGKELHFVEGGNADTALILLHGANRELQNAAIWTKHFDWLSKNCKFI